MSFNARATSSLRPTTLVLWCSPGRSAHSPSNPGSLPFHTCSQLGSAGLGTVGLPYAFGRVTPQCPVQRKACLAHGFRSDDYTLPYPRCVFTRRHYVPVFYRYWVLFWPKRSVQDSTSPVDPRGTIKPCWALIWTEETLRGDDAHTSRTGTPRRISVVTPSCYVISTDVCPANS